MNARKTPKFEDALKKLENIVETLEKGEMPLEDAIKAYTEGVKLVRQCHGKLEEAEDKITKLMRDDEGNWNETPFETDAPEE